MMSHYMIKYYGDITIFSHAAIGSLIRNLHINGIDELLLYLASNEGQWSIHCLEILFLMLREQVAW